MPRSWKMASIASHFSSLAEPEAKLLMSHNRSMRVL
jgi:hypothetical protein